MVALATWQDGGCVLEDTDSLVRSGRRVSAEVKERGRMYVLMQTAPFDVGASPERASFIRVK